MPADPSQLSFGQRSRYFVENIVIRGLFGALGLLPYGNRVATMGRIMQRISGVIGYEKRIRENLAHTCPELTAEEVDRLCREVADNVGRSLVELYAGKPFWQRAKVAEITGPGLQVLEKARAEGRPVLLITGHFGNYDAARSRLVQMGHEIGCLYRRMANPYFHEHYLRAISATGEPLFEQGKRGMVEMIRHLRGGGIIAIVADLHVGNGQLLPFMGQPAKTSVVPADIALQNNAVVIPVYAIRKENGLDFEIQMGAEIPHSDPETMTRAILTDLEARMRAHMGQWFWIHRRWKD